MAGNAAFLIDLENVFLSREERCRENGHAHSFARDLEVVCSLTEKLADDRPFGVKRAYANFSARRRKDQGWDYYLRRPVNALVEHGIEPVQVFGLQKGAGENAADIRMAVDAIALLADPSGVELFVLVTGDSDFVPVVLELRRLGARVAVIGVKKSTSEALASYCDRFEYLDDRLGERDAEFVGAEGVLHAEV